MSLTSANYNVIGNPSITSNFILTPTDENSYVTTSVATPSDSEFDIYTKVTAIDLQGVVGTGIMSIPMSSNPTTSVSVITQFRYSNIFTAISNIEGVQDSTSTYGPSISANTDYWIRLHVSSPATHKLTLYAIADNNYTRDTLPSTGWYVSQDIDVSSSIYTGRQVRLGWGNLISEVNPASISIDLKETFISVQGNVVWEAVQTVSSLPSKGYTNYTIIGDPTYNDGVYSDFRHDRYLQFPQDLKGTDKTYIVKFTTGSAVDGRQFIVNTYKFFTLCLYENYVCLLDWADNAEFNHLFVPAANTTYYVKAAYNGLTVTVSHSMDGTSWVQDLQYTYSELVTSKDQYGFSVGNHPVWTTEPFRGSIDLNDFYVLDTATQKVLWMPSTKPLGDPDYGSISISDGYYSNGVNTIQMPSQTIQAGSLKNGQVPGNRTKAYAVSSSGVASVKLVGNDATEQALKGTYDVYAALDQPVYLSHAENYLTSGDAGDISKAEFSYASGGETANYTVVGSPTIDENFVVSNFSPSNYVTTITPTVTSTFDMIARHVLPASASKNGTYPDSLSFSGADVGFGLNVTGSKFTPVLYFTSSSSTTATQYANTTLWTWLKMTTTTCELYVLEDSTNQYTLDTLPTIGSWTRKCYYSGSTNRLSYVSGKTLHFGINNANSNASANWTIDLKNSKYVADGVEWRGVTALPASVTIPKTFWYDSTGHNSYWYPQSVTVALADAKAEQTVGDVNRVFVTNELGQDLSGITLAEEEAVGDYTTSALVPFYNVYLDHDTNSYILGLQKDPDEIVVIGAGGYNTGYTVEGSVSITGDYTASGFSGSNYITLPETIRSTDTSWEIGFSFTTGSVSTGQYVYGCTNNNNSILIGVESSKLKLYLSSNGSSWDIVSGATGATLSNDTKYYIKLLFDGSKYVMSYSTDGETYTDTITLTTSTHIVDNKTIYAGSSWDRGDHYLRGSMYLSDFYISRNGAVTWRAIGNPSLTKVSIGTSDNWTALQNRTYWYEEGNTTDVSDLTSDTYEADLKGYLIFSEDANEDLIVKGYTSAYTVTTYNTPDVYSGYSYTVTDSTGTTIDSFGKTGTLCKAYTIPAMAGLKFVFIPAEDLEDGHVYEAGDIREAYSETNGTPFRQLDESTEDYTYNASTDTLTDENEGELTCIGHVYVEWDDIAE